MVIDSSQLKFTRLVRDLWTQFRSQFSNKSYARDFALIIIIFIFPPPALVGVLNLHQQTHPLGRWQCNLSFYSVKLLVIFSHNGTINLQLGSSTNEECDYYCRTVGVTSLLTSPYHHLWKTITLGSTKTEIYRWTEFHGFVSYINSSTRKW